MGLLGDSISETFDTTPGETYTATFWLAHRAWDFSNGFTVLWDGVPIFNIINAGAFTYTEFTFVEQALGTTSTLTFTGRDRLSFFQLDDVNVDSAETPEPATVALLCGGMLALLFLVPGIRRRAAIPPVCD